MADEAKLRHYLEKVTVDLRRAHQQVRDLEDRAHEPIAIVGMACRYPGGIASPSDLWRLVAEGRDAISEFPDDRGWDLDRLYHPDPDNPGTSYAREGGFLDSAGEFDPGFFSISPREAEVMDPQERLLLEASWEALEDTGIDPALLKRTPTGVFAGVGDRSYGVAAGMTSSIVSGRVSYALGLEGPALSIDTACSSSLVAMHLAAGSLRQGECTLALAAGVTVLSTPMPFIGFSAQRGLAPDGRCKSFADAADGVAWSEGVGVLVLQRLADAQRDGNPVLAVLRGSAVNQDGASNGLTAPNGPSQERVIRQALANARLEAKDVDVVEGHGTGTTLGDPIEAGALLATYGQEREEPLRLGSIKSNIGHAQAAAGIAGAIKMIEAMREGVLPKTLHLDAPSSKVDWGAGAIELLDEPAQWEVDGRPRRAGISSFGISGTNAHVILEEPPALEPVEREPVPALSGPIPLVLSAKVEPALAEAAKRLAGHIEENPNLDLTDVAYSLATTRTAFEHRAVVIGSDREELLVSLAALADRPSGAPSQAAFAGVPARGLPTVGRARDGKLAYLFTGQGSQRLGMGQELYEADLVFREAFNLVCEQLDHHLERPLKEIVFAKGKKAAALLDDTACAQPALFAIEVALFETLSRKGLKPDLLAGHSIGEIAAAHVAGVLDLPDAAKLVAARGRLMGALPKGGAMAAIEASEEEVEGSIKGRDEELAIAAINGPTSTVISGTAEAVEEVRAHWEEQGRRTKQLAVSHAFHSPLMEPMLEEFASVAESLTYSEPQIPIISNVTGESLAAEQATDPAYWVRHVREPVRFANTVETLAEQGTSTYLELGPDPVLCAMTRECLEQEDEVAFIPTLREGRSEADAISTAIAGAHAAGARLDWEAFFDGMGARRVPLPTYPFQRRRFWLVPAAGTADASAFGQTASEHPLLGAMVELADGKGEGLLLTGRLSLQTHPWLADHAFAGAVLLPAAAFLEMALRATDQVEAQAVEELVLGAPAVLPGAGAIAIRISISGPHEDGRREIAIHSRPEGAEGEWELNARGTLSARTAAAPEPLDAWPPDGAEPIDTERLYDRLAEHGLEYGPAFQCLTAVWRDGERIFVEASLPEESAGEASGFGIHPALLESAQQAALLVNEDAPALELPSAWHAAGLRRAGASALRLRVAPEGDALAIAAFDPEGAPIFSAGSVTTRRLEAEELRSSQRRRCLHRLRWSALPAPSVDEAPPEAIAIVVPTAQGDGCPAEAAQAAASSTLARLQDWIAEGRPPDSRLVLVTTGAVAAGEGEAPDLAGAAVWGLVRSAISEHPGRFALVDSDGTEASEKALPAALALSAEEPQLALREGELLAPRLVRVEAGEELPAVKPIDPERTVLITGGLGGLGALVARHLATSHGARHLLLVGSDDAEVEGAEKLRAELGELGAEVTIAACDVADRGALQQLFSSIPTAHPLGAIVHCAGEMDDGLLESMDAERLWRTMRPKATAAWHLHELSKDLDLSQFLLFSSAIGLLGGAAQANYAAANNFLDALAVLRHADGLSATSLAWGLWDRQVDGELPERMANQIRQRLGFAPMAPEQGLDLFDAAQALGEPLLAPVRFDAAALRDRAQAGALAPILRGLVRVPAQREAQRGSLGRLLAETPAAERQGVVLDLVRSHTAAVLGHASPREVEPKRAFRDMGLDSLGAVELRNRLGSATDLDLGAAVVFDHPSPVALAEHMLAKLSANGVARQVAARARASEEPIAIVGMACRYPGDVGSPGELWQLVAEGRDGISGFPTDRGWDLERIYHPNPDNPGTSYTREGGFLRDAGGFDAEFFAISPREAIVMDPQERLLLESCWEALEDAGIEPASLHRTEAGVFAGVAFHDYETAARGTSSTVSGRVSYTLGLEGPAITIDTACSSSLVAMHLASQALRQGECTLALAGGVTVLATPSPFLAFSAQRGLSPDGRCKSFAEAADGTGWGEGVGVLVLERLSEAQRNGHPVLALLKGSAVNQDGASNGLTAPNGPSQERVILQALASANLTPQDVDAVEAHGTGTVLGDPIEAGALLATYGQDREEPLKLGSLKSNIGHTQAAAGVGGAIKMIEAMRAGVLPRTLHVDQRSSKVDWEAGAIELLTEERPWEATGRPRRAGVSSFGVSGTNAHVILEEAPAAEPAEREPCEPLSRPITLALSAKAEPALAETAERLATHIEENPDLDLTDVAYSFATTRTVFEHRAVALGSDREELLAALVALADRPSGAPSQAAFAGVPARGLPTVGRARDGKLALLFTGQGSQRLGMGQELYEADPVFRETFDAVCEQLDAHLDEPLKEIIFATGKKAAALLEDTTYAQPALFAIEVALFEALSKRGLKPDLLAGHSIGEIAAAHVAGVFDLADAAKLVAARGRLMGALPEGGAMAAIEATEQEVAESIDGRDGELAIAAINGPTSTVISGIADAVEEIRAGWEEQGRRTKQLAVSHAFHSPLMEPMLGEFAAVAESLTYGEPKVPLVSNVTGELLTAEQAADPAYWVRHVREPVRFADAVGTLASQEASTYLELGPDPVLCAMAGECLDPEREKAAFVPTLRAGRSEGDAIWTGLAGAHTAGAKLDWGAFFAGTGARRVPLPTYPFQRKRYWLTPQPSGTADPSAIGQSSANHPLLGAAVDLAGDPGEGLLLTGRLALSAHPWLAGHVVAGAVLLPGTAFLELALRAADRVGAETVEELTLQAPLVLSEEAAVALQVSVSGPDDDGRREISIHSRPDGDGDLPGASEWICHAQGILSAELHAPYPDPLDVWPPDGAEPLDVDGLYDVLAEAGLEYGTAFRGLSAAWREGEQVYVEVSLPEEHVDEAEHFGIHPALLDAVLHGIALVASDGSDGLRLPFSWGRVSLRAEGARQLRVKIAPGAGGQVSLAIADGAGEPLATVGSLALRPLTTAQPQAPSRGGDGLLGIEWAEVSLSERDAPHEEVELLRCETEGDVGAAEAAGKAARAALEAAQQWLADESKANSRLTLISSGAMAVADGERPDPAAAAIWGLIRSAQSEHPDRFALIDTDGTEASEAALPAALELGAEEPQLALREGVALAPRAMPARDTESSLLPPAGSWRLDALRPGTLDSLALAPNADAAEPLAPTEVRVRMHAAGLNFRDVLVALGMYPGEALIGGEGAGVVVEAGSEVDDLSPGDRVLGLIPGAFGPLARVDRDVLVPMPAGWSFEQAAAMPIVFATAYYGLVDLAGLQASERVLIHAGAGGVGMAAIGIAKHLGAEVFATASPSKWEVLREMGIEEERIASSRDLDFREKFLRATEGEGVDVVLNALAGEFVDASLALMPRGGRFLEMGKTDVRDPKEVAEEHAGVAYRAFDLFEAGTRTGEILADVAALLERGALRHSPTTTWDVREAPRAFRHLREGANVGKVVLEIPRAIDPERTVLITGATGGLGVLVARHLAERYGARHLLLVSRSGPEAEGAMELKRELEELGAETTIAACDVSDRGALEELLVGIPAEHPLGAIVHCAGVARRRHDRDPRCGADRAGLRSQGRRRLDPARADQGRRALRLRPLLLGGGNRSAAPVRATTPPPTSSSTPSPSSARCEGLPATSIAWGLWEREGGMISDLSEADVVRMRRGGHRGAQRRARPGALRRRARRRLARRPWPFRSSLAGLQGPGLGRRPAADLQRSRARPQATQRLPSGSLATTLASLARGRARGPRPQPGPGVGGRGPRS